MGKRTVTIGLAMALLAVAFASATGARAATFAGSGLPEGNEPFALDPAVFTVQIDNQYWPMQPRTRWVYRETDAEGATKKVVVTVTTATKEVANGVTARIVRDTVSRNGTVVEDTFDLYAQDADGNIWYFGENTAEFARGTVASRRGSFEAGVDGALAGIAVPANPVDGLHYRQEYYAGEAEDRGEVVGVDEQVEVAAGHFDHVLMTKDTNPLEPKVLEFKFYAPGTGPALAIGLSGSSDREELLEVRKVSERAARAAGRVRLGKPYP